MLGYSQKSHGPYTLDRIVSQKTTFQPITEQKEDGK
jgi:hypothetical protein